MDKLKVQKRYATVPNCILNSKTLSFRAKGIWAYIYSKPDGWNFSIKNIASQSKEGVEAVRNALKELETEHLLKRTKFQNELGHWNIEYLLLEYEDGKPDDGKPDTGKPDDGKSTNNSNTIKSNTIISKKDNISNTNKNKFTQEQLQTYMDTYNKALNRNSRLTNKKLQDKLNTRLQDYTFDEIIRSLENMFSKDFYKGKNDRNWTPTPSWILENNERLEQFLFIRPLKTKAPITSEKFNELEDLESFTPEPL